MGPKAKINKLIKQFPEFAEQFPEVPSLIYKALNNAAQAQQQADTQHRELLQLRKQLNDNHTSTVWAIIISTLVISLAVLFK